MHLLATRSSHRSRLAAFRALRCVTYLAQNLILSVGAAVPTEPSSAECRFEMRCERWRFNLNIHEDGWPAQPALRIAGHRYSALEPKPMGQIYLHAPVLPLMAAFSRYETALEWAKRHAECHWGPTALISESFPFTQTRYYEQTMGTDLHKCFIAFQRLIDPAELIAMKHQTNTWEQEYQKVSDCPNRAR